MPPDVLLSDFDRLVATRPDAPLVATRGRAASVAEVDRAAAGLEERLAAEGVAEGDLIGFAAGPGPAFLAGFVALRRVGAVPVFCDSAQASPDRVAALDRLGTSGFLAEDGGWSPGPDAWRLERRAQGSPRRADPTWGAIKLTSGSTGDPRGIAVTSGALAADDDQLARSMGLRDDDRFLAAVPLAHSYGFSSLVLPALRRGSLLVVPRDRSPLGLLADAEALGATVFPTIPAWLGRYVRLAAPPPIPASVRLVLSAGAPLEARVGRAFRELTGRAVHVFYGASECGGIAFDRAGGAAERARVGAAVDGVALEIDPASGQLVVRSPAVACGYLPDPDPRLGGGRFLTSDLARVDATGEVELLGRADDWVIVRGRNVNPREIEAVLAELEGVDDVAVVGVDGRDGPRTRLRALVVAREGVDADAVLAHCRSRLAPHKVPRELRLVDEIPRTERGKTDRVALAALTCSTGDGPA